MNRLSDERRAAILRCLVKGNSIRATSEITGHARETIAKLLARVGMGCGAYLREVMKNLSPDRVEVDETWSFIKMKEKNMPVKRNYGCGDAYTWIAFDPVTRLVISHHIGRRDTQHARAFMKDLAGRVNNRIQLTSDGHIPYIAAVEEAFGSNIDFAQVVKEYSGSKYTGSRKVVICGNPDLARVSTSLIERQNGTVREEMRRFTRKTKGFSKDPWYLQCATNLHFMYYNFARRHGTLRVTPAMEAGLSRHIWELEEIANLAPIKAPKVRGPYKRRVVAQQMAA